jgi:RNA polymerase sigma-70 factor (ECF subfamily)
MFRRRPQPEPLDNARDKPDTFSDEVLGHLDSLYGTAIGLTRNRADAEDLVQDTVVKALRFEKRFERGTNLRAWLYTILHNTWRNRLRDAARQAVDVDSARIDEMATTQGGPTELETPERVLLRESLGQDVQAALDVLPAPFRQAVWLRDVEEFSYAEIAKMLDVPIGTVMSRISRGRRLLFQELSKRVPVEK